MSTMRSESRRKLEINAETDELMDEPNSSPESPSRSLSNELKRLVRSYYKYVIFGFISVLLFCSRRIAIPGVDSVIQMWPVCLICIAPLMYALRVMHLADYSTSYWIVGGFVLHVGIMYSIFCSGLAVKGLAMQFGGIGFLCGSIQGLALYAFDRFTLKVDSSIVWCLKLSAIWVTLEWLFSLAVGTFFCLGTPFGVVPFLLQPIKILGSFTLEFIIVFTNACIACAALKDRSVLLPLLFTWLVWIAASICLFTIMTTDGSVSISIVASPLMNHRTKVGSHYFDNALATARSMAATDPDLIVLPEKWVFADTVDESTAGTVGACAAKVKQLFNPTKSAFIVGCKTRGRGNFAVVSTRNEVKVYGKQNPMILINEQSVTNIRIVLQKVNFKGLNEDVYKKIEMQVRKHFSHIKINRLQELKIFNFKRIPRTLKVLIVGVMRRGNVLARFRKLLRIKYLIRCRS